MSLVLRLKHESHQPNCDSSLVDNKSVSYPKTLVTDQNDNQVLGVMSATLSHDAKGTPLLTLVLVDFEAEFMRTTKKQGD